MSSRGELTKGGPPDWWLNEEVKPPHRKKISMLQNVTQGLGHGQILLAWPKQRKLTRGLAHGLCDTDRRQGRLWQFEGN
jgi:hypothetical protein